MKRNKIILITIVSIIVLGLLGCAFFKGMIGVDKPTNQPTVNNLTELKKIVEEAKTTGNIDMSKLLVVLDGLANNTEEKETWYNQILYLVGIAAGTYLGTRKIRQVSLLQKIPLLGKVLKWL